MSGQSNKSKSVKKKAKPKRKPTVTVINVFLSPQKSQREIIEEAVRRRFRW